MARRLVSLLSEEGAHVAGFTTAEIRKDGGRVGFSIETIDGHRGVLAHVDIDGPRVGKYGVDVSGFEDLALPSLELDDDKTIVVIDELGKMELLSDAFRKSVEKLFDGANELVATVHVFKHPFTDGLKQSPDADVVKITRANRDDLPREIAMRVLSEPT
jgi:nucleoside-triphosphatase